MSKNTNDQKGQGSPNDQKNLSSQNTPVNDGKTTGSTNSSNQSDQSGDENRTSKGSTGFQVNPENTSHEQTKDTGAKAGIQNQGKTAPPKEKGKDVNNLQDEDKEELHEYEDLDHPHKVDTPKAKEQNNWETGENSVEGENQGPSRITNQADDNEAFK